MSTCLSIEKRHFPAYLSPFIKRVSFPPFRMRKVDPFKNQHELRDRNRGRRHRVITRRNDKRPGFKPLVVQTVTAPVPEQNLDPVAGTVEKHKKVPGKRVLAYNAGYECRQAVKTLAHVSRLQADENLDGGWQCEHAVLPGPQGRKHPDHLPKCRQVIRRRDKQVRPVRQGQFDSFRSGNDRSRQTKKLYRRGIGAFRNRLPVKLFVPPVVKSMRRDALAPAVGRDTQAAAPLGSQVLLNLFSCSKSHMVPPLRTINIVNEKQ